MPQHKSPSDFQVQPAVSNARAEAITTAIRHLEPAMRAKGKSINWDAFNQHLLSGEFAPFSGNDADQIDKAVEKYHESIPARVEPEV